MRHHNPNVIDIDPARDAYALAGLHGVDVEQDVSTIFDYLQANHSAELSLGITKGEPRYVDRDSGARYVFTQYDYTLEGKKIAANRMLAAIRPGDRTELAYWTAAAPTKALTIHRGVGNLALSSRSSSAVELIPLDANQETQVTLPPRSFYCLEADEDASGLLIVSGLYCPPVKNWQTLELEVLPGQEYITSRQEGLIRVADHFRERYEG